MTNKIEVLRKYRYIGTEHTMVRTREGGSKYMVDHGEVFASSLNKNVYPSRLFEFLGETTEEPKKQETVEETLLKQDKIPVSTIGNPILEGRDKAAQLYFEKFNKKAHWKRDEQTILSKLG